MGHPITDSSSQRPGSQVLDEEREPVDHTIEGARGSSHSPGGSARGWSTTAVSCAPSGVAVSSLHLHRARLVQDGVQR